MESIRHCKDFDDGLKGRRNHEKGCIFGVSMASVMTVINNLIKRICEDLEATSCKFCNFNNVFMMSIF